MYGQLSPDLPHQLYAELVQSREQERLARHLSRERKAARTLARRSRRRTTRPQPADVCLATPAHGAG